jgi:polysaccharide biosynthesis/export protein
VLDSSKMSVISKVCSCWLWATAVVVVLAELSPGQTAMPVNGGGNSATSSSPAGVPVTVPFTGDSAVRLGAGDLVDVSVYNVPELETKIRVNSEGNISLPLINDVHVEGLTVEEAETVVERRLDTGGFVKKPHVQIFVQEYTSQGASVLGEVSKPGNYPIIGDQKLFSLISAAGGFTDRAGKSVTVTHRGQAPTTVPISRNLEDHPESDIAVFPGDTIIVRRADVVYVVGDVSRPSGFLMDSGHLSVLQAIALAGGTNSTAKLSGARIIRKAPTGLTSVPVPLKKLMEAKTDDMPMEADDILFVPTSSRKQMQARSAEAAVQLATAASIVAIHP